MSFELFENGLLSAEELLSSELAKLATVLHMKDATMSAQSMNVGKLAAELFAQDDVKKVLANKPRPAVDAIFVCLKNPCNTVTVQHVLTAIGNLTNEKDPSQKWLVEEYDAIRPIISILKQSMNEPKLQTQAFYALQKLAVHNEDNIRLMFRDYNAHQLAFSSMTKDVDDIPLQTQACTFLRRLSFIIETHASLIDDGSKLVLRAMRSFLPEEEIQEHGCAFLGNLASNSHNQKLLVDETHRAHEAILVAMRTHFGFPVLQTMGCCAIRNLTDHVDNERLLVCAPHLAHEAVLAAMRAYPQDAIVQEDGCGAIWNLTCLPEHRKLLASKPYVAHEVILTAIRNHSQAALVQKEGCGALKNLAVDVENKKLLAQCEAHLAAIAALRAHPKVEVVQLQAILFLFNISRDSDSNKLTLQHCDISELCRKAEQAFPDNNDISRVLNNLLNYL